MPDRDEPEEGFTIRDRRRGLSDSPAATPQPTPAPEPLTATANATFAASTASEMPAPTEDDLNALDNGEYAEEMEGDPNQLPDVYSILAMFLGELRNIAWLRMGLVANPSTGEFEIDMEQAKVAINTVGFLASQIEPVVAPEEKLPLRALVSDLQVNFTNQVKRASGDNG